MPSPNAVGMAVIGSQMFIGMKYGSSGMLPQIGAKTGILRVIKNDEVIVILDVFNQYNNTTQSIAIASAATGSYLYESHYIFEYIPSENDKVFKLTSPTVYGAFTANLLNNETNRLEIAKSLFTGQGITASNLFAGPVGSPPSGGVGQQPPPEGGGSGNQPPPESSTITIVNVVISPDGVYRTNDNITIDLEFSDLVKVVGGTVDQLQIDVIIGNQTKKMRGRSITTKQSGSQQHSVVRFSYTIDSSDFDSDGIEIRSPVLETGTAQLKDDQYPTRNFEVKKTFVVPKHKIFVNVNQNNTVARLVSAKDFIDPQSIHATTGTKYFVDLVFDRDTNIVSEHSIMIECSDMTTRTLQYVYNSQRERWNEPARQHRYVYTVQNTDGPDVIPIRVISVTPSNAIRTYISGADVDLSSLPIELSKSIVFNPSQIAPTIHRPTTGRSSYQETVTTLPHQIYLDVEFFEDVTVHNGSNGNIVLSFYMVADQYSYIDEVTGETYNVTKNVVIGTGETPTPETPLSLTASFHSVVNNKVVRFAFDITLDLLNKTILGAEGGNARKRLTKIHMSYVEFGFIQYRSSNASITVSGYNKPFDTSQKVKHFYTGQSTASLFSYVESQLKDGFWIEIPAPIEAFSVYIKPFKTGTRTNQTTSGKFLLSNGSFALGSLVKERDTDMIALFVMFRDTTTKQLAHCDQFASIQRGNGPPPSISTNIGQFVMPEKAFFDRFLNGNPPSYLGAKCWMFVKLLTDEDDIDTTDLQSLLTINGGINWGNNALVNTRVLSSSLADLSSYPKFFAEGNIAIMPSSQMAAYQLTGVPGDGVYGEGQQWTFVLTKPSLPNDNINPPYVFGSHTTTHVLQPQSNVKVYMPIFFRNQDSTDDTIQYKGVAFATGTISLENASAGMPDTITLTYTVSSKDVMYGPSQIDVWPVLLLSGRENYSAYVGEYGGDYERLVTIGSHTTVVYRKDWSAAYQHQPIRILNGVRIGGVSGTSGNNTRPMWVRTYAQSDAQSIYIDPYIQQYTKYIYNPSHIQQSPNNILKIFVVFDRNIQVIGNPKLEIVLYDTKSGMRKPTRKLAQYHSTLADNKTVRFDLVVDDNDIACSRHSPQATKPLILGSMVFDSSNKIVDASNNTICASPYNPAATHITLDGSSAWNAVENQKYDPYYLWYSYAYAPYMKDNIHDIAINEHIAAGGLYFSALAKDLEFKQNVNPIRAGDTVYLLLSGNKRYEIIRVGNNVPSLSISACMIKNAFTAQYIGVKEKNYNEYYYIFAFTVPDNFPPYVASYSSMLYPISFNKVINGGLLRDTLTGITFNKTDATNGTIDDWDKSLSGGYIINNNNGNVEQLSVSSYSVTANGTYNKDDVIGERIGVSVTYNHQVVVVGYRNFPDNGADNVYPIPDSDVENRPKLFVKILSLVDPLDNTVPYPSYLYFVGNQFSNQIKFVLDLKELQRIADLLGIPVTGSWKINAIDNIIRGSFIISLKGSNRTSSNVQELVYKYNSSPLSTNIVINIT